MSDDDKNVGSQTSVDELKALDRSQPETASKSEKEQEKAAEDYSKHAGGNDKDQKNIKVRVYSPFNDYYNGQAISLSAVSATGPFDILPMHRNFISLLEPCVVIVRTEQEGEKRIKISGGIMHVKANQVVIFLDV